MSGGAADAVEGLLLVVDGEEAEDDGDAAGGVEGCDALGDALAHVVEVGCVAAHHGTEDDNGVGAEAVNHPGCGEGELNRAGDGDGYDVGGEDAVGYEGLAGSPGELGGDVAVPFGGDYGYAGAGFDGGDGRCGDGC